MAMMAVGAVALVGMGAFVIDVGGAFRQHGRHSRPRRSALAPPRSCPRHFRRPRRPRRPPGEERVRRPSRSQFARIRRERHCYHQGATDMSPGFLARLLGFSIFASRPPRRMRGATTSSEPGTLGTNKAVRRSVHTFDKRRPAPGLRGADSGTRILNLGARQLQSSAPYKLLNVDGSFRDRQRDAHGLAD